jgi:predicted ester cyclase
MTATTEPTIDLARALFDTLSDPQGLAAIDATVDRVCAPGFVDHERPPQFSADREGYKGVLRTIKSAFSDLRFELVDYVAAEGKMACRVRVSGRHTGTFFGLAPTQRTFSMLTTHFYHVEGGRLIAHWANRDDLGMFRQLGLLPEPPAP